MSLVQQAAALRDAIQQHAASTTAPIPVEYADLLVALERVLA